MMIVVVGLANSLMTTISEGADDFLMGSSRPSHPRDLNGGLLVMITVRSRWRRLNTAGCKSLAGNEILVILYRANGTKF